MRQNGCNAGEIKGSTLSARLGSIAVTKEKGCIRFGGVQAQNKKAQGIGVLVQDALESVASSAAVVAGDGEAEGEHVLSIRVGTDLASGAANRLGQVDRSIRKNGHIHGFSGAKCVASPSRVNAC
jgi:hypothetical protein